MGTFGDLTRTVMKPVEDKKKREAAAEKNKRADAAIAGSDWTPMYASETTPTFRKAQSPVARSYLESFVTGANADAVNPNAPGAKYQKAAASRNFNQQFGSMNDLLARQRTIEQSTPWAVKTPTREINPAGSKAATISPSLMNAGISRKNLGYLDANNANTGVKNGTGTAFGVQTNKQGQQVFVDHRQLGLPIEIPVEQADLYLDQIRQGVKPAQAMLNLGLDYGGSQGTSKLLK